MNVALLGMGRLGRSLAVLLPAAGHPVRPWRRDEAMPPADVYWVTVNDDAIDLVAPLLPAGAVALHASGARGPEALGDRVEAGVLHPLMTFPGPEVGLPPLPGAGACVAGTPRALAAATTLARALGMVPFTVPGDRRLYHAAACLASGHLAATFQLAVEALIAAGVPAADAPGLLHPLAAESLRRVASVGPAAITGPAARGDEATIAGHRAALRAGGGAAEAAPAPDLGLVYDALTDAIRRLRAPRSVRSPTGKVEDG